MENLRLVKRAFAALPDSVTERFFRADMSPELRAMCAAVPPCGRFGANAAWYRLCNLTYNVLSALKTFALPPQFATARPKRLRFAVFTLAGRISSHARRVVLRVARALEAAAGFIRARTRLAALLHRALAAA